MNICQQNKIIGLIAGKSSGTLTRALQGKGYKVALICGKVTDDGYDIADFKLCKFFEVDNDEKEITESIDFFKNLNIDGFILGTGTWFAIEIAIRLGKVGLKISHSIDVLKTYKDKSITKQIFRDNFFPVPKEEILFEYKEPKLTPPFVVKSNIDLFPVFLCHSYDEFNLFINSLSKEVISKGVLVEEYIKGNDCTIPVFSTKKNVIAPKIIYWSKQENYRLKGFGELEKFRISEKNEKIILQKCQQLISKSSYLGVCRFDIRISEDSFYFLEINSVVSIREEGSSFQAMKNNGINYIEESL